MFSETTALSFFPGFSTECDVTYPVKQNFTIKIQKSKDVSASVKMVGNFLNETWAFPLFPSPKTIEQIMSSCDNVGYLWNSHDHLLHKLLSMSYKKLIFLIVSSFTGAYFWYKNSVT